MERWSTADLLLCKVAEVLERSTHFCLCTSSTSAVWSQIFAHTCTCSPLVEFYATRSTGTFSTKPWWIMPFPGLPLKLTQKSTIGCKFISLQSSLLISSMLHVPLADPKPAWLFSVYMCFCLLGSSVDGSSPVVIVLQDFEGFQSSLLDDFIALCQ